jgi:serine phosphatase RsbU (regulator of sigma subunit)
VGPKNVDITTEKGSSQDLSGVRFDREGSEIPRDLSLPYDQKRLALGFRALEFRAPDDVRYRYRLEGAEKEWSPWQKQRSAIYNDLLAGKYRFIVEAKGPNGVRSEKRSFSFRIRPPWWRTDWFRGSSVAIVLLSIFLIFRWRTASIRKRKKELEDKVTERTEEIEAQRAQLETKNREITDSIDYASSIQNALLPDEGTLQNALGDHFVFFRPRDMVSGDLYWCYAPSEDLVIWMVADCTGHGVPGAFMGMMGSSLLDEVIVKGGERDPGRILDRIRDGIVEKVGGERKRDGMAAAICAWDKRNGELRFAGGQNHLFLVRENVAIDGLDYRVFREGEAVQEKDSRLRPFQDNVNGIEVHGDKRNIGLHHLEENPIGFASIAFSLREGDRLYLYSDGFPDQFGGPKDKKYGYRPFKSMLASNAFLSMEEQKEQLRKALDEWKGEREQLDDICVMGVRIKDPKDGR